MLRQHAHATHLPLNGVRIAGTSTAIALHAIVLMLLFTPTTWAPPKVDVTPETLAVPVDFPLTKIKVIADTSKPVTHTQKPADTRPATKPAERQEVAVVSNTGPQIPVTEIATHDDGGAVQPTGVTAELSPDVAPTPPYPILALRAGTTGLVILRITIDIQGHPVAGSIEKSSGSRLLDQSALKFVLARWHFNPAMQAGSPVSAVALVPIAFTLD
jgi:protein TonB